MPTCQVYSQVRQNPEPGLSSTKILDPSSLCWQLSNLRILLPSNLAQFGATTAPQMKGVTILAIIRCKVCI